MAALIVCPLCRSEDVEIVADITMLRLFKCRKCGTAFSITPPLPGVQ
jgi:uncharacterized Zn finger protein